MNSKQTWYNPKLLPARRSVGKTYGSVSGLYSFRGVESIPFESTLERDFLIRLDFDQSVESAVSQPFTIEYYDGSAKGRQYTPDYLVRYRCDGEFRPPLVVEVKPQKVLRKHFGEWREKFRAAVRACNTEGYLFKLTSDVQIRDQQWENGTFLSRYRKMKFEDEVTHWILDNLRLMGVATFDYLLARHFHGERDRAVGISHLWHLISIGKLRCDLSSPLSHDTEVWIP